MIEYGKIISVKEGVKNRFFYGRDSENFSGNSSIKRGKKMYAQAENRYDLLICEMKDK